MAAPIEEFPLSKEQRHALTRSWARKWNRWGPLVPLGVAALVFPLAYWNRPGDLDFAVAAAGGVGTVVALMGLAAGLLKLWMVMSTVGIRVTGPIRIWSTGAGKPWRLQVAGSPHLSIQDPSPPQEVCDLTFGTVDYTKNGRTILEIRDSRGSTVYRYP